MTTPQFVLSRTRLLQETLDCVEKGMSVVLLGEPNTGRGTILDAVREAFSNPPFPVRELMNITRMPAPRDVFYRHLGPGFMHGYTDALAYTLAISQNLHLQPHVAAEALRSHLRPGKSVIVIKNAEALHQGSDHMLSWLRAIGQEGTPVVYSATREGWDGIGRGRQTSFANDVHPIPVPRFSQIEASFIALDLLRPSGAEAYASYIGSHWPDRFVDVVKKVNGAFDQSPIMQHPDFKSLQPGSWELVGLSNATDRWIDQIVADMDAA